MHTFHSYLLQARGSAGGCTATPGTRGLGTTAYYAAIIMSLITAEKQDAHGLDRHPALVSY